MRALLACQPFFARTVKLRSSVDKSRTLSCVTRHLTWNHYIDFRRLREVMGR